MAKKNKFVYSTDYLANTIAASDAGARIEEAKPYDINYLANIHAPKKEEVSKDVIAKPVVEKQEVKIAEVVAKEEPIVEEVVEAIAELKEEPKVAAKPKSKPRSKKSKK